MRDETVTAAVGDFLRNVSHTAQREIEKAIRNAVAAGRLKNEDVPASITLRSEKLGLDVTIHSRIEL